MDKARRTQKPRQKPPAQAARKTNSKSRKKGKRSVSATAWLVAACLGLVLLSPLYYGYVLKAFSAAWNWARDPAGDPAYRKYESFGIRIPRKHSIHGIDVSYYQDRIDWQRVARMEEDGVRIRFAFIKATEGLLKVDRYFQRNWREAPKAGLICGAYHFFRPARDGKAQARFFLQVVGFEKNDLLPVVDVESLDGVTPLQMRAQLSDFLAYMELKTGVKPIIYTGLQFYSDYLAEYFKEYPLWIAHYDQPRLRVPAQTRWHFWQHSDKARVDGISHVVDFNAFNGDSLALEQLRIR
ncbi:glycoside hydrolase family 25 protein [Pedobacter yulinensis]|uniref:glycoside hydrolase family 25 protein n=1 Tax=Pedobacter yulinensis TaxID=2126353 RepID=UPI001EF8B9F8|nr:glycoside hydrolase family 25 protein [Pedobacter yulinensis]